MLPATPAPSLARVRAVDGVALTVSDAERAAEFYTRVLFFEKMSDFELPGPDSRVRIVRMRLGDELIELFKDPDGHPIELIQFPADKGVGRWRRPTDRVFLGIDHSAAVDAELREGALS